VLSRVFQDIILVMQMYAVAMGLILGAMNKLPIMRRRGLGRRNNSASSQQTVTFDDVAGIDEAKEELSEIVVGAISFLLNTFLLAAMKLHVCMLAHWRKKLHRSKVAKERSCNFCFQHFP